MSTYVTAECVSSSEINVNVSFIIWPTKAWKLHAPHNHCFFQVVWKKQNKQTLAMGKQMPLTEFV